MTIWSIREGILEVFRTWVKTERSWENMGVGLAHSMATKQKGVAGMMSLQRRLATLGSATHVKKFGV